MEKKRGAISVKKLSKHVILHCEWSRLVWLRGPLSMKVNAALESRFDSWLLSIWESLKELGVRDSIILDFLMYFQVEERL